MFNANIAIVGLSLSDMGRYVCVRFVPGEIAVATVTVQFSVYCAQLHQRKVQPCRHNQCNVLSVF